MLTLASETRAGIDLVSLSSRVEQERLARALHEHAGGRLVADGRACADGEPRREPKLAVDGEPIAGPLFRGLDADSLGDRAARRSRTAATARSRSASPCAACRRRRSRPAATTTR